MHDAVTPDEYKMIFCELSKENQQYIVAMQRAMLHKQEMEQKEKEMEYENV